MFRFFKVRSSLLFAGLAVAGAPFATQATSLPGIPASGNPTFTDTASLTLSRTSSGFQLTATLVKQPGTTPDILFHNGSLTYPVSKTGDSFVLTANFNQYGVLQSSSTEQINGQIPSYPGKVTSPLYGATLDKWNLGVTGSSLTTLGFETTNPTGWARQFQCNSKGCSKESVYFTNFTNVKGFWNLASSNDGTANNSADYSYWKNSKNGVLFTATANAITTVPLPAGALLLLSGLTGLGGIARRRAS